jgi:hypothetical protein
MILIYIVTAMKISCYISFDKNPLLGPIMDQLNLVHASTAWVLNKYKVKLFLCLIN